MKEQRVWGYSLLPCACSGEGQENGPHPMLVALHFPFQAQLRLAREPRRQVHRPSPLSGLRCSHRSLSKAQMPCSRSYPLPVLMTESKVFPS